MADCCYQRLFLYYSSSGGDNLETMSYGFGAFSPILNADNFCTFLAATLRNVQVNNSADILHQIMQLDTQAQQQDCYCNVDMEHHNILLPQQETFTGRILIWFSSANHSASKAVANKVYLLPVMINETSTIIRGELPGIKYLNQQLPYVNLQIFTENEIFIAKSCLVQGNTNGQIVLKVGDL